MKKYMVAVLGLASVALSIQSHGATHMSVEQLNNEMNNCYQQTEYTINGSNRSSISIRPCVRVIRNTWTSRHNKALSYVNLGIIQSYQGEQSKAINSFNRGLKLNPQVQQAHLALGQIYLSSMEYAKAKHHLEKAMASQPYNMKLVSLLAKVKQLLAKRIPDNIGNTQQG
jgi:tetratricopeptide (TPR) repeat protein